MKLRLLSLALLALLIETPLPAEQHNAYPLPEERGAAGTLAALQRLPVYAKVLYTTAHPDDEGAGMMTWLARKAHVRTALYSLTRGDGGQNVLGNEKYEAIGLVRTGELLEACKIYGVEPYFSTVYEFGFSKSADETLEKWGREATLEEMVRFIRMWRPTIVISRFSASRGDGHGHHQAAGIITPEAYQAASDPKKFPEHLGRGLLPWQALKLYESGGRRGGAGGSVSIQLGDYDPVLGRSYQEIGVEGYSKHRTQGNGARFTLPGRDEDSFRLVNSAVASKGQEQSLFDSIDTSLQAILGLAGKDKAGVSFLQADLAAAQQAAAEALRAFQPAQPAASAPAAARGAAILSEAIRKVRAASIPEATKGILLDALEEKLDDFHGAVSAVLGIYLVTRAEEATAIPGQKIQVTGNLFNRGSEAVALEKAALLMPEGWVADPPPNAPQGKIQAGSSAALRFAVTIPEKAALTQPFWYRESPNDSRYKTRPTRNPFAPFDQPEIIARVLYRYQGTEIPVAAPAMAQIGNPIRGADFMEFQVVPALSVSLKPDLTVVPMSVASRTRDFQVSILNNVEGGARGSVRLVAPQGWQPDPAESSFSMSQKGESFTARFTLRIPQSNRPGSFPVEAVASLGGREYRQGYRVISYPENWTRNLYAPARSDVHIFDVKTAPRLRVGYVAGAGDEVPDALAQLGAEVAMLSGADLAFGDLSRFSAIVTGIRAYNVNEDLAANNRRLLKYVEDGGILIVQYVRPLGRSFGGPSPFPYGPYPMSNSNSDRITVEESPLEILEPRHPVFNTPNRIVAADFDGWVQERGLYFMSEWDPRYTALLSGHDPGEQPKKGGMLIARYGKGYYIYTAYAWFRQLPAGIPGAFRIFANMLSLGK